MYRLSARGTHQLQDYNHPIHKNLPKAESSVISKDMKIIKVCQAGQDHRNTEDGSNDTT